MLRTGRRSMVLVAIWVACIAAADSTFAQAGPVIREGTDTLLTALRRAAGPEHADQLARLGGEAGVRQLGEQLVRTGGDDALEWTVRATRAHGPDTLRALDRAEHPETVRRALAALPEQDMPAALRRLAGTNGGQLAETVEQVGVGAIRAELRHPGVGGAIARHLGDDGVQLTRRMPTNHVIEVTRHAEDIARLPAEQRAGLLRLLREDTEAMVRWMGRFAEQNPGKVLFTASVTTWLLANPEAIAGDPPVVDGDGNVVAGRSGLPERLFGPLIESVRTAVLPIMVIGLALWLVIKLWFAYRTSRFKCEAGAARLRAAMIDRDGPGGRSPD